MRAACSPLPLCPLICSRRSLSPPLGGVDPDELALERKDSESSFDPASLPRDSSSTGLPSFCAFKLL